jgi:hypothetical protein
MSLTAVVEHPGNELEEYAAPVHTKPRAATIAGEINVAPSSNVIVDITPERDEKYMSLNRDMMDNQPHYEDLRREDYDWEAHDHEDDDDDQEANSDVEITYAPGISEDAPDVHEDIPKPRNSPLLKLEIPVESQGPEADVHSQNHSLSLDLNLLSTNSRLPRLKSPILLVKNVPLARQSVDGEYVVPNEAYEGGVLSPPDLPDYIDIA